MLGSCPLPPNAKTVGFNSEEVTGPGLVATLLPDAEYHHSSVKALLTFPWQYGQIVVTFPPASVAFGG